MSVLISKPGVAALVLLVRFAFRDLTCPGESHFIFRGCTGPYPGQAVPDAEQRLHPGCVKSQTKLRLRHSQQ